MCRLHFFLVYEICMTHKIWLNLKSYPPKAAFDLIRISPIMGYIFVRINFRTFREIATIAIPEIMSKFRPLQNSFFQSLVFSKICG